MSWKKEIVFATLAVLIIVGGVVGGLRLYKKSHPQSLGAGFYSIIDSNLSSYATAVTTSTVSSTIFTVPVPVSSTLRVTILGSANFTTTTQGAGYSCFFDYKRTASGFINVSSNPVCNFSPSLGISIGATTTASSVVIRAGGSTTKKVDWAMWYTPVIAR